MKIKDLPGNKSLLGVKFKHPDSNEVRIWASQWNKGVWYKKSNDSSRVYPLQVESLEEALEWEVVDT